MPSFPLGVFSLVPFPGIPVETCPLDPEPPGWQTVVTEGTVEDRMVEVGPGGPAPGVPYHPSYALSSQRGWGRSDEARDRRLPTAHYTDGQLQLWGEGWSCQWLGRGCMPGEDPAIRWPDQPFASFATAPGACLAAEERLVRGIVVVLGTEVVALANGSSLPYVEVARFPLPSPVRGTVTDESADTPADHVVIRMADGRQAILAWTEDKPQFAVLGPLDGPVRFVDDRVLATREGIYGLSEDLRVAWHHAGPVISLLRLEDALWWITGDQTTQLRGLDPVDGKIRRDWKLADGAPLYGELRSITFEPRVPGRTVGAQVWFYVPPEAGAGPGDR